MQTPQEIDVWYVLPAVRRELAMRLIEKGLRQRDIAQKLGVTEAAVSQYVSRKRASTIKIPRDIMKAIDRAADNMINNRDCHRYELQSLLEKIRKTGFLCEIHRLYDTVPKCCNVCMQKA